LLLFILPVSHDESPAWLKHVAAVLNLCLFSVANVHCVGSIGQWYLCDMLHTVTSHKTRMLSWAYKENELGPTLVEEIRFLSV